MSKTNEQNEVMDAKTSGLPLGSSQIKELNLKTFALTILKPLIQTWIAEQLSGKMVDELQVKAKERLKERMTMTPEVEQAIDLLSDYFVEEAGEYLVAKIDKIIK